MKTFPVCRVFPGVSINILWAFRWGPGLGVCGSSREVRWRAWGSFRGQAGCSLDLGPGGLGQAGGGQGGPAAGRAAGLKGVRGLQSRHSYCPLVAGVTGQQGSREGCLASGNSHCSCCGNRGQIPPCSHPVRRFRMVGGLCTLMGFYLSPLHRDGGGQCQGVGGRKNGRGFPFPPPSGSRGPSSSGGMGWKRGGSLEVN